VGPLAAALSADILAALKATEWPQLDPTMESVITGPESAPEADPGGGTAIPDQAACTWGSLTAPVRVVLVGDSVALSYVGPLREIALESNGQIQVHTEAMSGCKFVHDALDNADQSIMDACPARKQHAVEFINTTKPSVVIISNSYRESRFSESGDTVSAKQWGDSMRGIVDKFRSSTQKVVFLGAPPADVNIADCYGEKSSAPADCISRVTPQWVAIGGAEKDLAVSEGGVWVDSRPWFCTNGRSCPSFVGTIPTKHDAVHMSPAYGLRPTACASHRSSTSRSALPGSSS
jgi:hypothetical protein